MAYSNHGRYLETEVFSADPVELVRMLYRGAMEATALARRHLRAGEIAERSRHIMRAFAILGELSRALDPKYEQISRPLGELYAYMRQQLLEANAKQVDAPLAEVERLLATLYDGWKSGHPPVESAAYRPFSCTY